MEQPCKPCTPAFPFTTASAPFLSHPCPPPTPPLPPLSVDGTLDVVDDEERWLSEWNGLADHARHHGTRVVPVFVVTLMV